MVLFVMILAIAVIGGIVYKDIYDSTNHCRCNDASRLSIEAKIVNISTEKVGTKGHKRFRTTVVFSDGFEYISHDTNVDNYVFAYRISLSASDKEQIVLDAIEAHKNAIEKYERKRTKNKDKSAFKRPLHQ